MNEQFEKMRSRITGLQKLYLPDTSDPLGDYSQEQQDNARAYVLLSHAEIENYLEDLSLRAGKAAVKYIDNSTHNELSSRFLFFCGKRYSTAFNQDHSSLSEIGKAFSGLHANALKTNHGVKKNNLSSLFGVFIFETELDSYSDLIASLDSLGSLRGKYAHNGWLGISETINPFDCKSAVDIALTELSDFSEDFEKLIETGSFDIAERGKTQA